MNNSRFILFGRILLLSGAVAVVFTAFALRRATDAGGGGETSVAVVYACPMHPEVTGTRATGCPICGMALEPLRPRARVAGPADTFSLPTGGSNRQFFDVMFARLHPVASEMRGPAWIDSDGVGRAILFNDEVTLLREDERGSFVGSGGDAGGVPIRLIEDAPTPWDSSTSTIRFRIDDGIIRTDRARNEAGTAGAAAAVGWIKLAPRSHQILAIPATAIVQSPRGPYVLVSASDRRTFSKRPVQLGRVMFGYATILAGVKQGERVVAMNTFFLDSERRLRTRSSRGSEATTP